MSVSGVPIYSNSSRVGYIDGTSCRNKFMNDLHEQGVNFVVIILVADDHNHADSVLLITIITPPCTSPTISTTTTISPPRSKTNLPHNPPKYLSPPPPLQNLPPTGPSNPSLFLPTSSVPVEVSPIRSTMRTHLLQIHDSTLLALCGRAHVRTSHRHSPVNLSPFLQTHQVLLPAPPRLPNNLLATPRPFLHNPAPLVPITQPHTPRVRLRPRKRLLDPCPFLRCRSLAGA